MLLQHFLYIKLLCGKCYMDFAIESTYRGKLNALETEHIQAIIAKDWSDHFSEMYRDEEFIFFPGLTPNYLRKTFICLDLCSLRKTQQIICDLPLQDYHDLCMAHVYTNKIPSTLGHSVLLCVIILSLPLHIFLFSLSPSSCGAKMVQLLRVPKQFSLIL